MPSFVLLNQNTTIRIKIHIARRKSIANASHYSLTKNRNVSRKYKKTHTVLVKLTQNVEV